MKILLLGSKEYPFGTSHAYDQKAGGGIEAHVDKLAKYLSREGHDVYIITRRFPGQAAEEIIKTSPTGSVHVKRTRFIYNPLMRAMTFNLFAAVGAMSLIRREGIELIHCHGAVAGFFGAVLSGLSGKPMVFTPHGTVSTWSSPIKDVLRFFESVSVLSARKTLFISPKTRKEMTSLMEFPNALLTNAIDFEDYALSPGAKKAERPTRFLFLGRLERIKGVMTVLQAFAEFAIVHPESTLTVAGDGAMRNEVQEFIRKNRNSRIDFMGWISAKDIPELFSRHDVFLLPSAEKGQPVALLEAMASGKIIITSLDYIDDLNTGIKTSPFDPKELYDMMLYAYENPECRRFGENAKLHACGLGWDAIIKSFLKEYKEVVDNEKKTQR